MQATTPISREHIMTILGTVKDPEVPVLSVTDLGIIRAVSRAETADGKGCWEIVITPTYSGCPAMDMIATGIRMAMYAAGIEDFVIRTELSPAWTTDWMTEEGKAKLLAYGIAPPRPLPRPYRQGRFAEEEPVPCPRCGSDHTRLLSEFGSTACKSLYQCADCREPFDYFKCH
jgi:ring-1,2-phenylacetyl-CoA epoxidase subunit PaaD